MPSRENPPSPAPLVEVQRGGVTESWHRGHVSAVEPDGRVVGQLGAPETVVHLRSTAKPFQALPLVTSGAADRFGLSERELAVICGSHGGEAIHIETVRSILEKCGLDPQALQCGPHEPYDTPARKRLRERGEPASPLHNNCSGKHAGMLALALHLGAAPDGYLEADHPVQQRIRQAVGELAGVPGDDIPTGIDGCGVPSFALPLRRLALMYARLAAPPAAFTEDLRDACARLRSAMTAFPEMVEGTEVGNNLDTALMRSGGGRLVSKVGAEGVYAAGVLPSPAWPDGVGLAFKIEDGDGSSRARGPLAVELLIQLGVLPADVPEPLEPYRSPPLRNHRGETVGQVRVAGRLA